MFCAKAKTVYINWYLHEVHHPIARDSDRVAQIIGQDLSNLIKSKTGFKSANITKNILPG